ncbi:MAG: ribosome biogenesis GTPase YlqF [Clostridia bacterium]|nr:ribosome biogenesis GTPase YlqF [Clostridia bacterium]
MQVQWFPGHMAKTRRLIQEQLKLVDAVIEIVDARIPQSSRNPLIDELIINKPIIIVLNKEDLADEKITELWLHYFNSLNNMKAIKFNATILNRNLLAQLKEILMYLTAEKREQRRKKGIKNATIRTMVVGIPNVGKSTFINNIVGIKAARTGNMPGVTRGKQWIRLDKDLELLDTPGILWPKFDDENIGFRLAITGAINDEVFNQEEGALELIKFLQENYPALLCQRYKLNADDLQNTPLELMDKIAVNRGCLLPGKNIDYEKISKIIIKEFRGGQIGRITLEKP